MTDLADVADIVAGLRAGDVDNDDINFRLLDFLADHEVDDVLQRLDPDVAASFAAALRVYDNDKSPDDFYIFSSAIGDHPDKHAIVASARRWLARERTREISNALRAAEELAEFGTTERRCTVCRGELLVEDIGNSYIVRCKQEDRIVLTSRGI